MSDAPHLSDTAPVREIAPIFDRRHVMLTLRADRSEADFGRLAELSRRAEALGLEYTTLAAEVAKDREAWHPVYLCHNECRKRQPPVELRVEPIPTDAWRHGFLSGEKARPDAYFIAREKSSGACVAVCALVPTSDAPDTLECGFTGTLPDWSGRGIALAIKAHAMSWAWIEGFQHVETRTLQINRPIRAVNEKLGFRIAKRHVHTFRLPALLPSPAP